VTTASSSNGDETTGPRVAVKEAVQRARAFLKDLYEGEELPNLRLEEVELSDDERHWLVTFGFTASEHDVEHGPNIGVWGGTTATRTKRDYKRIRIDADTGEAMSMKIRKL
jgi:hypothetical protein